MEYSVVHSVHLGFGIGDRKRIKTAKFSIGSLHMFFFFNP